MRSAPSSWRSGNSGQARDIFPKALCLREEPSIGTCTKQYVPQYFFVLTSAFCLSAFADSEI